jgi:hypothetical protein
VLVLVVIVVGVIWYKFKCQDSKWHTPTVVKSEMFMWSANNIQFIMCF